METYSLERSFRAFSINDASSTTGSSSENNSPSTLELNSHLSLPYQWEQFLDLKVRPSHLPATLRKWEGERVQFLVLAFDFSLFACFLFYRIRVFLPFDITSRRPSSFSLVQEVSVGWYFSFSVVFFRGLWFLVGRREIYITLIGGVGGSRRAILGGCRTR